jgi:hypothetical protein
VCAEGAKFILVRQNVPTSSNQCFALSTTLMIKLVGVTSSQERERGETHISVIGVEVEL